jgi:predicted nucleic acid-binding protein
MLAYLRGETGADVVELALSSNGEPCMAHAINVCEVYYKIMMASDEDRASSAVQDLKDMGLVVREDLYEAFWQDVGLCKASINGIPLADCFVVTLANSLGAEAMTADHGDFGRIKERGLFRVRFIRPKRQTPGPTS